jgi:glycerate 2-kinase
MPATHAQRREAPLVLVAPDSFKGTFPAPEVARAIAAGLHERAAQAELCPLGDGGEGTAQTLLASLGGVLDSAPAHDPLGRPLVAGFGLLADGSTAVLDTAAASGLPLLAPDERDPESADTAGTGELIVAAIERGASRVLVAAGGSASTDGGQGAIESINRHGGLRGAELEVLCDVRIPFEDAARVFAPQKGASPQAVRRLTARLEQLAQRLPRDPRGVPMTGSAGGLAGGLWAAFGATLRPGAEYVLELVGFDARALRCAAVVTGEGKLDEQSFQGKLVGTIAASCRRTGTDLHVVVGQRAPGLEVPDGLALASVREASTLQDLRSAGAAIAELVLARAANSTI